MVNGFFILSGRINCQISKNANAKNAYSYQADRQKACNLILLLHIITLHIYFKICEWQLWLPLKVIYVRHNNIPAMLLQKKSCIFHFIGLINKNIIPHLSTNFSNNLKNYKHEITIQP